MVKPARVAFGITAIALSALSVAILVRFASHDRPAPVLSPPDAAVLVVPSSDASLDGDAADLDAGDASDLVVDAPSPPSPVDDDPLCAAFARGETERIAAIARAASDAAVDPALLPPNQVWCRATPHGAWAATLDQVTFRFLDERDSFVEEGTWSLVHLGRDLARVAATPDDAGGATFAVTYTSITPSSADYEIALADDYDGDGEPEVAVHEWVVVPEGDGPLDRYSLYTYARGAVAQYPPSRGLDIARFDDVDRDGRRDLVLAVGSAHDYMNCISARELVPFEWAARATPDGRFDTSGAASRRFARAQCTRVGRSIVHRRTDGLIAAETTARAIVCARLEGKSPDAIRDAMAEQCDEYADTLVACAAPLPSGRTCFAWMHALAGVELPAELDDGGADARPPADR